MDQKKKGGSKTKKKETVPIWKLFQFASKVDLLLVVVASICSCAAGAIQPISILFFGDVLKSLSEAVMSNDNIVEKTRPIILIYVYLGTGIMVTAYISNFLWVLTGENQARRIRQLYVHSILGQDMSWFDRSEEGSLNTRLAGDIQLVQDGISERFGQFLMCLAQFIAGCIVAFTKGWRLSILMLVVTPVVVCTGGVMAIFVTKYTVKAQDAYADAGSISEQVFSSIRTIYAFSLQQRFTKLYDDKLQHSMRAGVKRGIVLGFGLGTVLFSMFAVLGLSFWYGAGLVQDHAMDGSTVLVVFMAMLQGELTLLQLPNNLAAVLSALAAAYKVFETIKRVPEIDSNDLNGLKPQKIQGKLEFKHVKFRYPTRPDVMILKDFSLKIEPGMTVAFVGPSGSGKSTSVQLLQRFYDPLSGEIALDDKSLKMLNVKWLREQIGVVSQEPVLFNTSIRENIMMGSTDKNISLQDIITVCKKANCHSFIKQLPKGYDTLVGEHGAMISGGQKQRIAIARAILKNPAILLLDEATSALDVQSERLVQNALDEASANRTTLVIAHRLSTVRNADLIVVMENGSLIEQGTHDDLLAMNGVYKELVLKQQIQTSDDNNRHTVEAEENEYNERLLRNEAIEVGRKSLIELQRASEPFTIASMSCTARKSKLDKQEENFGHEMKDVVYRNKPKAPIWRIIKQMRHYWPLMALGTAGSALAGSVFPLHSLLFAKVIASLIEDDNNQYNPMEHRNFYSILFVILGVMAFFGFSLQVVCFETAGSRYTKKLRSALFVAFMKQEIGYFDQDQNNLGSLTSKLAVDAKSVNEMITRVWPDIIQILFTSSAGLTIAFMHSWMLTLVICCMSPFVIGAAGWNSKVQEGYEGNTKEANEQSAEVANEAIKEIRTVTALNKQRFFEDKYDIATKKPHQLTQRKAYISSIGFAVLQSISFFSNAVGFYAGAILIMQHKLQLEQMMIIMMAVMSMSEGIGRSSICVPIFSKAKIASIATFEIMDRQPVIDPALEGIEPGSEDIDGSIDFNNISFRYPARPDISIFDGHFNLKAKSGQTIALVGPSGSGKSTVIGMLQRWYDPLKGTVRFDNHNVKSFSLKNLRSHMALVGQEPILFDLSIEDNVRLGVDDTKYVSREQVEEACKAANIHAFISSLPDGYNTRAGAKGSQLSGGQKQRIAIARALIRKPKLLLLDEATSALDSESEKLVQEALDNILQEEGRTTITIAHRLSTITNADLICVIKDGRVIEQGNHWDLLKLNGVYKDLVQQQSLNTT